MPIITYLPKKLEEEKVRFRESKGNIKLDFRSPGGVSPTLLEEPLEESPIDVSLDVFNSKIPTNTHVTSDNSNYRRFSMDIALSSDDFQRNVVVLTLPSNSVNLKYLKTEFFEEVGEGVVERYYKHTFILEGEVLEGVLYEPIALQTAKSTLGYVEKTPAIMITKDSFLDTYEATPNSIVVEGVVEKAIEIYQTTTENGVYGALVPLEKVNPKILGLRIAAPVNPKWDDEYATNMLFNTTFSREGSDFAANGKEVLNINTPNYYLYSRSVGTSQKILGYSFTVSPNKGALLSFVSSSSLQDKSSLQTEILGSSEFIYGTEYTGLLDSPFILLKLGLKETNTSFTIKVNGVATELGAFNKNTFSAFTTALFKVLHSKGVIVVPCKNYEVGLDRRDASTDIEIELISKDVTITSNPTFSGMKYLLNTREIPYSSELHPTNLSLTYLEDYDGNSTNSLHYKMKLSRDTGRKTAYLSYRTRLKFDIDQLYMTTQTFEVGGHKLTFVTDRSKTPEEILLMIRDKIAEVLPKDFIVTVNATNGAVDVVNNSATAEHIVTFKGSKWMVVDSNYGGIYYQDGDGSFIIPLIPSDSPVVNNPPTVTNVTVGGLEDTVITGKIEGKDQDGDFLAYRLATPPSNGTAVVRVDGTFSYTPNPDYNGKDEFTITVDDGKASVTGVVSVNITPVKDINDDGSLENPIQVVGEVPFNIDVLANDNFKGTGKRVVKINGTPVEKLSEVVLPNNRGTVKVENNYSLTVVPNGLRPGSLTFKYSSKSSTGTEEEATVFLNVSRGDIPAALDKSFKGFEDILLEIVLEGVDNERVDKFKITTNPAKGKLYLDANKTKPVLLSTEIPAVSNKATIYFLGDQDWFGNTSFKYICYDNKGIVSTESATIQIELESVIDKPVAPDYHVETDEDVPFKGRVVGYTPDEGVTITYELVTHPMKGKAVVNKDTGEYTYTPNQDYFGTDSFKVLLKDGRVGANNTCTIYITIHPVNDDPVLDEIFRTTVPNFLIKGLAVGYDVEDDPLTYSKGSQAPSKGIITVASDGNWTYKPNTGVNNTTDVFTIKVSDDQGGSSDGKVNITISDERGPIKLNTQPFYTDSHNIGLATFNEQTQVFTPISETSIIGVEGYSLYTLLRANLLFRKYGLECIPLKGKQGDETQYLGIVKVNNKNLDKVIYTTPTETNNGKFFTSAKDLATTKKVNGQVEIDIIKTDNVTLDVFSRPNSPKLVASVRGLQTSYYSSTVKGYFDAKDNIVLTVLKGYNLLESITFNPLTDGGKKILLDLCRFFDITEGSENPQEISSGVWDSGWCSRNTLNDTPQGKLKVIYRTATREVELQLQKTSETNVLAVGISSGLPVNGVLNFPNYRGFFSHVGSNKNDLSAPSLEARFNVKYLILAHDNEVEEGG